VLNAPPAPDTALTRGLPLLLHECHACLCAARHCRDRTWQLSTGSRDVQINFVHLTRCCVWRLGLHFLVRGEIFLDRTNAASACRLRVLNLLPLRMGNAPASAIRSWRAFNVRIMEKPLRRYGMLSRTQTAHNRTAPRHALAHPTRRMRVQQRKGEL
jgi:hypothetical protein